MFSRFVWRFVFIVFVLLFAGTANADSIFHINQAVVFIGPNFGFGDNVGSLLAGPGISVSGGGGAACEFCSSPEIPPFSPGQSLNASVDFIAAFEFVDGFTLRGTTYSPDTVTFGTSFITSGIFTFPVGRKSPFVFTVTVPALFSDIHGIVLSTGENLTLAINPGKLVLNFDFAPGTPDNPASYTYTSGEFVTAPEPSAFLMLGTGLLGVLGGTRKMFRRG
jgi:PEP-CTERM motif-containing protein